MFFRPQAQSPLALSDIDLLALTAGIFVDEVGLEHGSVEAGFGFWVKAWEEGSKFCGLICY